VTAPCDPWLEVGALPCSADLTDETEALAIGGASFVLWALGGRRHGLCTTVIRPCRPSSLRGLGGDGHGWHPALIDGEWWNVCGHAWSTCGCGPTAELRLPYAGVQSVTQVRVGADVLVAGTDYRLDPGGRLVRLGGEQWPVCQDLTVPVGAEGAFDVTFVHGVPLDDLALIAAGELACELGKSIAGKPCKLPARVTSLTRQGVSMTFLDPQDFLTEGRTGLYLVDLWLAAVNPERQASPSMVYSPDIKRPRLA
jgi:hypothetical protein